MSNDHRINSIERTYRPNNSLRQRYREQPQGNGRKKQEEDRDKGKTNANDFRTILDREAKRKRQDGFER